MDCPAPHVEPHRVRGEIICVDSFGNLITNIEQSLFRAPFKGELSVRFQDHAIETLSRTYGEHSPGELVALWDSQNRLEIAIVNGSAAAHTGANVGDAVCVTWSKS